jgi:hypothetical protein
MHSLRYAMVKFLLATTTLATTTLATTTLATSTLATSTLATSTLALTTLLFVDSARSEDWNQAAGPQGNFNVDGEAPIRFSATHNDKVLWRTPLPNSGQGAAIVSNERVFVASHAKINEDSEMGSLIVGQCFDAKTGELLWERELPGSRVTDFSSLFSDNTAASPVADGKHVCFVNVGGMIRCFDFAGNEKWSYKWVPFGRHHARQHEPVLHNGNVIVMQVPRADLDPKVTTKEGAKPLGRGKQYWTHLLAFDLATGKQSWQAECGTSVHAGSLIGRTASGQTAFLTGRGGGHQPPEDPYGVSLVNANDGKTIWEIPIKGFPCAQNMAWNSKVACVFAGGKHLTIDVDSGKIVTSVSVKQNVTVRRRVDGAYVTRVEKSIKGKKAITNQTNCLVGDYHYFLAHDDFLIGRVNIVTGKVEYLQVPVQVIRRKGKKDSSEWTKALPNDMKTSNGFVATQDRRNAGSGWGHVSAASPIVVGDKIYIPTMIGMVYVLKWNAEELDETAVMSISDLGPATETWSLSNLSFANGKLYARTLKELICFGEK